MKKPYIFGHRGAMGYCIENTIPCFKKGVNMGAGIETDIQLTKDKKLVCFHDYQINQGSKLIDIKRLTLKDLLNYNFEDKRKVATVEVLFKTFRSFNHNLKYSFDIRNRYAGSKLIKKIKEYKILDKVIITDSNLRVLKFLRKINRRIKLGFTVPFTIKKINQQTMDFKKLKEMEVEAVNLNILKANDQNFKNVIDSGLECYFWGVNTKIQMKKVLLMKYKKKRVHSAYSDFPDIFINLRDKYY